jgi:hypothetical protein
MILRCAVLLLIVSPMLRAQQTAHAGRTLAAGTPLWIKTEDPVPLHVGQEIQARTVYATYSGDQLVVPAGTVVRGSIVGLQADRQRREGARLRADFTPFSRPIVQFHDLVLEDGTRVELPVGTATDGAPIRQLTPSPVRKGGFLRQQIDVGVAMAKDRLQAVTGPGKKDRLKNLLYSQLPYHPQEIAPGTVWTVDTLRPVDVAAHTGADVPARTDRAQEGGDASFTFTLQAYLEQTASSAKAKVGDPFCAVVAEPVRNAAGEIEVPQGAVLEGEVTRARPARRFGRAGELRFDFRKLRFPDGTAAQQVQTTLQGMDADSGANLTLDHEGKVKPKPKDKVVVPLVLLTLAGRPLDRDHGDNAFGKDAVASNSIGVIGFLVGTAGGWPNVAAGIGYYGSALAIWNRWIKRGQDTTMRRDTRLVVQATARRSAPLPSAGRSASPGSR